MNNQEWHSLSPRTPRPYRQPYGAEHPQRAPMPEITLHEKFIEEERKFFALALKQNEYGRFLRITEEKNGKRNTVIVPVSSLDDLLTVIKEMVEVNKTLPPPPDKSSPAPTDPP